MNINLLKIFYFAVKYGSISAAANALFVTQPAVTKGLQRLQDFYEIKLINLFGRKLALTDAGEVLYGIAEKIFDMEEQAEEVIRDFQGRKRPHPHSCQRKLRGLLPPLYHHPLWYGKPSNPFVRQHPSHRPGRGRNRRAEL